MISFYNLNEYVPIYKYFTLWNEPNLKDPYFKLFIDFIEMYCNVPIKYVSIGKNKEDLLLIDHTQLTNNFDSSQISSDMEFSELLIS